MFKTLIFNFAILYKKTILKIEMEKARRRLIEAGKLFGEKHPKEEGVPNSEQALEEEHGKAIEIAAKKVGLALTILKIEMEKARRRQLSQLKQFREENTVPPILGNGRKNKEKL